MTVKVSLTLKMGTWHVNLKKCHGSGIFRTRVVYKRGVGKPDEPY